MNKIIIILSMTLIFGCGVKEKNEYPAEIVKNFMDNCNRISDNKEKLCSCILEKIQIEFTFQEFTALELKTQAGQNTSILLDFLDTAKADCDTEKTSP